MNDPRKFKAPYNPRERIWQEADRLRAAHPVGRELPVKVLDLAEFDLHLGLVSVSNLRAKFGVSAEVIAKRLRAEKLWPPPDS